MEYANQYKNYTIQGAMSKDFSLTFLERKVSERTLIGNKHQG
jgi:hypothetical protein